jgi:hypothetical protein
LSPEREAAREAVESFPHVARAWAFESSPASTKRLRDSYIDEVKACDPMLLIVGCTVTPAVREECDTAHDYGKPILAFAKDVPEREPEAVQVLRLLDAKYAPFTDAADLREKVRVALGEQILRWAKQEGTGPRRPGDRVAQLRALARRRAIVRVSPIVPQPQYDQFIVVGVTETADAVMLEKSSQSITIPTSKRFRGMGGWLTAAC